MQFCKTFIIIFGFLEFILAKQITVENPNPLCSSVLRSTGFVITDSGTIHVVSIGKTATGPIVIAKKHYSDFLVDKNEFDLFTEKTQFGDQMETTKITSLQKIKDLDNYNVKLVKGILADTYTIADLCFKDADFEAIKEALTSFTSTFVAVAFLPSSNGSKINLVIRNVIGIEYKNEKTFRISLPYTLLNIPLGTPILRVGLVQPGLVGFLEKGHTFTVLDKEFFQAIKHELGV